MIGLTAFIFFLSIVVAATGKLFIRFIITGKFFCIVPGGSNGFLNFFIRCYSRVIQQGENFCLSVPFCFLHTSYVGRFLNSFFISVYLFFNVDDYDCLLLLQEVGA